MPAINIFSSGLLPTDMPIKILKTVTPYLAWNGHETRSSTLRGRFRVFESRTLKKISGPKTEAVTEGQTKIHSRKLHELYITSRQILG
jgi:hypothetical protein